MLVRLGCNSCNRIMPSHARIPPTLPLIPSTPFEAIVCDFFNFIGNNYLISTDRLSGWLELQHVKVGTREAGAEGLCNALRKLMATFGVPTELSSDGGPEFSAGETKAFLKKWGFNHRVSSVAFPSSNGRAELAVKASKRMLMNNVSPSRSLDNDAMVRALLVYRNTPDPGCKLSPAQILFGRTLRDTIPSLSQGGSIFDSGHVANEWKEAWAAKEAALKTRYMKTLDNLDEHTRKLHPLNIGDHVLIQNQSGPFPKKWDKSGIIVEVKTYDQYSVRVDGSGRITLRNRRFLRRFHNHDHLKIESTYSGTHTVVVKIKWYNH